MMLQLRLFLKLNPLGTLHFAALQKMDQKQVCLSAASFACFPFFVMQQNVMTHSVITRGASLRSPFVCLLYFGEAK
ncbi:hypothetical protein ACO0LO_07280 [Undibacterium sp. TJN25]|uniref:hypothetical protein n=1 Tax=Undibacterium sp. TJN25 TaxID=3413056 RepID=UPI003BF166FD